MPFGMGLLPLLVGAGAGIAGGLATRGGSSSSSSSNNSNTALTQQQQAIIDIQKRLADYGIPAAKANYEKAGNIYDTSLSFYNKLLSGSDEEILKLIRAEDYTKSADESQQLAYNVSGRTGARAAVMGNVVEDRAANLNRILSSLRSAVPAEQANIAQAIANMGGQQLSAAMGGLSNASNSIFGLSQLRQQEDDRRTSLIASIIGTAGSVAGAFLGGR